MDDFRFGEHRDSRVARNQHEAVAVQEYYGTTVAIGDETKEEHITTRTPGMCIDLADAV